MSVDTTGSPQPTSLKSALKRPTTTKELQEPERSPPRSRRDAADAEEIQAVLDKPIYETPYGIATSCTQSSLDPRCLMPRYGPNNPEYINEWKKCHKDAASSQENIPPRCRYSDHLKRVVPYCVKADTSRCPRPIAGASRDSQYLDWQRWYDGDSEFRNWWKGVKFSQDTKNTPRGGRRTKRRKSKRKPSKKRHGRKTRGRKTRQVKRNKRKTKRHTRRGRKTRGRKTRGRKTRGRKTKKRRNVRHKRKTRARRKQTHEKRAKLGGGPKSERSEYRFGPNPEGKYGFPNEDLIREIPDTPIGHPDHMANMGWRHYLNKTTYTPREKRQEIAADNRRYHQHRRDREDDRSMEELLSARLRTPEEIAEKAAQRRREEEERWLQKYPPCDDERLSPAEQDDCFQNNPIKQRYVKSNIRAGR